jgi:hypothetical protein
MKVISDVKSNIEQAISNGIPADEIQAYIKSEGYTYDEIASTSDTIAGYLMKAVQGVTLGHADEIGGGLLSLTNDKSYKQNRDQLRTAETLFNEANPVSSTAAEIAGGLPTGLLGVAGKANTVKNLTSAGAKVGAVAGHGYGEGETLEGKAADVVGGTVTGGLMGLATKPVVDIAKSAVSPIRNMISGSNPNKVGRDVVRDLTADGLTVEEAFTRLKQSSPQATLADVGGANTKQLADLVANTPGAGQNKAVDFLQTRGLSQSSRIMESAEQLLGKGKSYYDEIDSLLAQRKAEAAPLYDEFVNNTDNLVEVEDLTQLFIDEPFLVKIFEKVGKDPLNKLDGIPENSIRYIDTVKKSLQGKADTIARSGDNFKAGNITGAQKKLVELADLSVPGYADARKAFAVPTGQMQAMADGRKFMKGDHELTARKIQTLSAPDKEGFLAGVLREIDNIIMSAGDNANMADRVLGSEKKRAAIKAAFGDDEKYASFEKLVKSESMMHKTKQRMTGGSPTQPRQAKANQAAGGFKDSIIDLAQGNTYGAGRNLVSGVSQELGSNGYSQPQLESLSDILYSPFSKLGQNNIKDQLNRKQGLLTLGNTGNSILNAGLLSSQNTQITPKVSGGMRGLLNYR